MHEKNDLRRPWTFLWAKTGSAASATYHPLILHLLDVACCAEAILEREPSTTRKRMGDILGLSWEAARPWILTLAACHDLGKASPGFQMKWSEGHALLDQSGLSTPKTPHTDINHAFISQIALSALLQENGWPEELAILAAAAVGCHHGSRASPVTLNDLDGDRRAIGKDDWVQVRSDLMEALQEVFSPTQIPIKPTLSGPDFMLLAGLTSFADWIGSNESWFPFGTVQDCEDLSGWRRRRKASADIALDEIGWEARTPLCSEYRSFEQTFEKLTPRPLQQAVASALADLKEPAILLVEAPMGEGKTEAAFYAHLQLQRKFAHRGLYIALPTMATGNAMFERTLEFLRRQGMNRTLDLQLIHGARLLNETFQNLHVSGIHDSEAGGDIRAGEWFTTKKRALLSEYGVGTVDQAILTILPVRHNFVRLWGLANRVVVFDEIHAYDAYTGTLLVHLLRWLLALGASVVLLSATLSPSIRRKLADVVKAKLPEQETEYPRLSVFRPGVVKQVHFEADPMRRRIIRLKGIAPDLLIIQRALDEHLASGGMALALMNTVQRAQDFFKLFLDGEPLEHEGQRVGKRLTDGTEVYLFHARFPADRRRKREDVVLRTFGQNGKRDGRKILIATQVAEQSLDLDFDLIATDLAPIDLVLQRAGRLWRHGRGQRPIAQPILLVAGLTGDEPQSFGKPLWWSAVYREDLLLRTWILLHDRQSMTLPDEIDVLVQVVYEDQLDVPGFLRERLEKAMETAEGEAFAYKGQANQAIIGFPDDASWNRPERFVLYDEDDPRAHRTLMAQTRLGDDSIITIPLFPEDEFHPEATPDFPLDKQWFLRGISVSRKDVLKNLRAIGVPEGWKKSMLLRNCYPLVLDALGKWREDQMVRLDDDLGLVYESKEVE